MFKAPSKNYASQDRHSKQVDAYSGRRPDVLSVLSHPRRVLDVGCNTGSLARDIRGKYPSCKVWGVDINRDALRSAEDVLETAFCVNLDRPEELRSSLHGLSFDTIVAADVLEHTINPWQILEVLRAKLDEGGEIIVSLPNFGHWETLLHLFLQRLPRRSRGIYDDTHLRFFLRGNLDEFESDGFRVEVVSRNYRCYERRPTPIDKVIAPVVSWLPWLREYVTFQWIIRITKER